MANGATNSAITQAEHENLISLIEDLTAAIEKLPADVEWGSNACAQDAEILDYISVQTLSLRNATHNVVRAHYRDTYHLLRMVYEAYFLLRLISTCDKYPLRIKIKRGARDPNLEHAQKRVISELQQHFGDRLVGSFLEDRRTLVAVLRGIPVVDAQGKDTGVIVPYYYQAWHDFHPVAYHLRRQGLQGKIPTLRFLQGEWAVAPRKLQSALDRDYGLLYSHFLTFDRVLYNLCLNGVLNKKLVTRVLVHYSFLSSFSHSTSESLGLMSTRATARTSSGGLSPRYDYYLSELALLYVCHLLSMHLQHAMFYLRWRSIKLKNTRRTYRPLCRRVERDFGYFWFIFNRPHQYDRYAHANRKCDYRRQMLYRPEGIRLGDVRYYDDPLYRLKQMHQDQRELTTGNIFESPFSRRYASF